MQNLLQGIMNDITHLLHMNTISHKLNDEAIVDHQKNVDTVVQNIRDVVDIKSVPSAPIEIVPELQTSAPTEVTA